VFIEIRHQVVRWTKDSRDGETREGSASGKAMPLDRFKFTLILCVAVGA